VHPYSTGSCLAGEFARRGWPSVAVLPADPLPVYDHPHSFRPGDYAAAVTHLGDAAVTAAALAALGVTAVIAGTESGIGLADVLAALLGLPGSDPATSAARRDKGAMADALARAGVAGPVTVSAGTLDEALAAAAAIGGPVVVKPAASAASDSVTVCRSRAEVAAAWAAAAGTVNLMGLRNDRLLVQELLAGQQYTVNTVTAPAAGGEGPWHYVTDVWLDRRREIAGGRFVYDRMDRLAGDDPRALMAGYYVAQVLTALGVAAGPAHTELVHTSRGPVLIEVNARLAGMADPVALDAALAGSQVSLAAEAVTDPAAFARRRDRPYRRRACAVQLDLAADRAGIIDPKVFALILSRPTVAGAVVHAGPGQRVRPTVDLMSSPAMFYLVGTEADVEADVAAIRALERRLYR
jgi:biotin carboxylase